MPWYFPWSDSIKKRAVRYLLQHYLGHFLKEKLSLEQLSVDLYNGTGCIKDVMLDVVSLNEALDGVNAPIEIVDGFIGSICVTIPWSTLMNDNTCVEIQNLEITLQPRQRPDNTVVMLDSMFSSMTTSMQLAQECLKQGPSEGEQQADNAQPFEGLEMFAQTIEAVLSRIKVSFKDTIIRLEHLPKDSSTGAALECRIARIEYYDDLASNPGSSVDTPGYDSAKNVFEPAAIAHKNLKLMGVQLFCDEFPASHRTFNRSFSTDRTQTGPHSPQMYEPGPSPPLFQMEQPKTAQASSSTEVKDSEPIQIASFTGKLELKLKIKQKDELPGPKLELDSQFGSMNMHLSPRQVHLLLEIANGLATPDICDDSNMRPIRGAKQFESEREPHRSNQPAQSQYQSLGQQQSHGWGGMGELRQTWQEPESHLPLDDSDEEIYFDMPHGRHQDDMESSFTSSTSTKSAGSYYNYVVGYSKSRDRESPFQATIPKGARQSRNKPQRREPLQKLLDDPTAETNKYKFKISFVSAMVLHEDPPKTPSDGIDPEQTSWEKLRDMAHKYFSRAQGISTTGMNTDLAKLREDFSKSCPHDHLSLLCKPITIECTQKVSAAVRSIAADVSIGIGELVEAVFDRHGATHSLMGFHLPIENILPEYCEILTFEQDISAAKSMYSSLNATSTPCIKVKVSSVEQLQSSRRPTPPKTDVHIELGKCRSEVDMTLVDRIQSLLKPRPLAPPQTQASVYMSAYKSLHPAANQSRQALFSQTIEENSSSEHKLELKITASNANLRVRFPIPDLRTGQGVQKPWWRRCLREECLIFELTDLEFTSTFNGPDSNVSKFEITCREGHGLFQLNRHLPPMSFIRISAAESSSAQEKEDGFDWPRLVVDMYPQRQSVLEEVDENSDDSTPQDSLNGACQFPKCEASPFSSKKTMYDNEEMVMPGDRAELLDFQEKASNNTKMSLDFNIPSLNIVLPNKEFFELIYNRLINDMALWEPSAPTPLDIQEPYSMFSGHAWSPQLVTQLTQDMHLDSMQKSVFPEDSDSDSEESSNYCFYPSGDPKKTKKRVAEKRFQQSKMTVNVTITKGKLKACDPLLDDEGKKRSDKQGEFMVEVGNLGIFTCVHYNGDPELQYLCVQARRGSLFHGGCVDIPSEWPIVEKLSPGQPQHLDPTIYLSEPGVCTRLSGQVGLSEDTQDMVSVAVKIKQDSFRNVKEYQVAVGVRGGTLQHRMSPSGQSWFDQLVEFFGVVDYPVLGYTLPKIVTELHCHLWSCAVDYRPRYLPYRVMLTVESFSICSNIVAESATSLLRFLVDDAAFYITDKCNTNIVDLKKNYVCVMDMGLFELALRTSDGKNPRYPKTDLKLNTNILHIRTCSDSFHALGEIITYFAGDQDLEQDPEIVTQYEKQKEMQCDQSQSSLSSSPQLSQSHLEQVHDMMADAMKESSGSSGDSDNGEDITNRTPSKMFFFPDEGRKGSSQPTGIARPPSPVGSDISADSFSGHYSADAETGRSTPQPTEGLPIMGLDNRSAVLDHFSDSVEKYSDDDEFCIINDPGLGVTSRDGEPRVRALIDTDVEIVDNHFKIPLGKTDLLKAPDHFPVPVYRYILKEMSIVWYMYGGRDFQSSAPSKFKHSQPYPTQHRRHSGGMGKIGWQARGGLRRNIDVLMELQLNKVRFQHELYPETTVQASRQILLISEVEIRDRLLSSKINKFLYQYTSSSVPRQTHANMVMIKALHVRPDPTLPAQECSMKVSLQPLRLNIDQDSLFFLRTFFTEITEDNTPRPPQAPQQQPPQTAEGAQASGGKVVAGGPPAPVMGVGTAPTAEPDQNPDLLIMFDELEEAEPRNDGEEEDENAAAHKAQPTYFKSFVFSPDVPIRLDYQGKRVDTEQGTMIGLVVGLAHLNCSELRLKRIHHRHGLLGIDRLVVFTINEWLQDIKKNQLPSILGGVGPLHSLVQLVHGIRDLFWLPVEQYKKDGRIVRGLQRGANSFMTCTAMSALELSNRVVQTIQYAAEVTYDMVSPGQSVRNKQQQTRLRRVIQPADLREGVTNAYTIVKEGLRGTAGNIYKIAVEEHELKGMTGAVGGVLRQVPPSVIEPVIIASDATSNILSGMRNQLLPDRKKEDEEKWKTDN